MRLRSVNNRFVYLYTFRKEAGRTINRNLMRRADTFKDFLDMKVIRRILSGKFLDVHLYSHKYQLVHIRIVNLAGSAKLSIWEEVYKGDNSLAIDVSSLIKGPYKIIVDFPEEHAREELFTIC